MPDSIEIKDSKITQDDFGRIVAPAELDLIAFFNVMEDQISKLISKAEREGWRQEQLMDAIEELI